MPIAVKLGATVSILTSLTIGLAACSSSGGSKAPAGGSTQVVSTPASTPATMPATTPATTPASSAPAASGTPADAATTAAVTKAYTTFFGGTKDQAALLADLQNGDKLTAALAQQAKNPLAATLTATVSKVTLENPSVADVTFSLLSKGSALLPNTSGKAVKVDGTWKLAATTFCGLVAATGTVPPDCEAAGVTDLPSS